MIIRLTTKPESFFAALRVFDKDGNVVFYRSTRNSTMSIDKGQFTADIPEKYAGCKYDLRYAGSDKIIEHGELKMVKKKLTAVAKPIEQDEQQNTEGSESGEEQV